MLFMASVTLEFPSMRSPSVVEREMEFTEALLASSLMMNIFPIGQTEPAGKVTLRPLESPI
jgi:hypothetical protein